MNLLKYSRMTKNQGPVEATWTMNKEGKITVREAGEIVTEIDFCSLFDMLADKAVDIADINNPGIKRRAKGLATAVAVCHVNIQFDK